MRTQWHRRQINKQPNKTFTYISSHWVNLSNSGMPLNSTSLLLTSFLRDSSCNWAKSGLSMTLMAHLQHWQNLCGPRGSQSSQIAPDLDHSMCFMSQLWPNFQKLLLTWDISSAARAKCDTKTQKESRIGLCMMNREPCLHSHTHLQLWTKENCRYGPRLG